MLLMQISGIFWSRRLAEDICARIPFLLIIFLVLMTRSAHGITSLIQEGLDKLRDMILDRVTLKQGKTHCGRGLITDPIADVMEVDTDLE